MRFLQKKEEISLCLVVLIQKSLKLNCLLLNRNVQEIEVKDLVLNTVTTYKPLHAAAKALNIPHYTISKHTIRKQKKSYKGRYIFKKL